MDSITIIDDFLSEEEADTLEEIFLRNDLPWYYTPSVTFPNSKGELESLDSVQFVHPVYQGFNAVSNTFQLLGSFTEKLNILSYIRVRVALQQRTPEIRENPFHIDIGKTPETPDKNVTTCLYYINSNDGYTMFESGRKVESVKNRLVTFPNSMLHCGTTCTNAKVRIVMNINYLEFS